MTRDNQIQSVHHASTPNSPPQNSGLELDGAKSTMCVLPEIALRNEVTVNTKFMREAELSGTRMSNYTGTMSVHYHYNSLFYQCTGSSSLECPITTELFQRNGYDLNAYKNVRDILYNTDTCYH